MRTAGSAFFVLLSLVIGIVALPAAWIATHLAAQEGFVRFASPLANDPEFTGALTAALVEETTASVALQPEVEQAVQPLLAQIAEGITGLPGFDQAWDDTLRRSHALTFSSQGSVPAEQGEPAFLLDIAPLVALLTGEIGGQLGVDASAPEQTVLEIGQGSTGDAARWVQMAGDLWPVLAAAFVVSGLIGIAVARRRSSTLALLGSGIMLVSAGLWLAAMLAPDLLARSAEPSSAAGVLRNALAERAGDSFQEWCLAALAGGILLAVAGIIGRLVSGTRR
ncbi:hypothetical protein GC088_10805 [Arthrobacter sp. JZ12]|uniref:hypothetical protein n=1 Tax=Arthrobacter sp. JZ12 TaxID=2654190 RepID=UPI002B498C16|nr:hypothetical protein [Arthrobacter sp. JZ12]WRH25506.1 hypothetical protein GC088_10805 [Arthrobacter sp. JZ12]